MSANGQRGMAGMETMLAVGPTAEGDLYGGSDQHYTLAAGSQSLGKYDESSDFPGCGRNRHCCP